MKAVNFSIVLLTWLLEVSIGAEILLTSEELKAGIEANSFNVLLDVRSAIEFNSGHIEGATLAESLASFGTSQQVATPGDLAGCEFCDIAVYCRSGNRARQAIRVLEDAGFVGNLYNGQGTFQWTIAGYELVQTGSTDPQCLSEEEFECKATALSLEPSTTPSLLPSVEPSSSLPATAIPSGLPTSSMVPSSAVSMDDLPPKKSKPNETSKDDANKLFQNEFDLRRGDLNRRRLRVRGRR